MFNLMAGVPMGSAKNWQPFVSGGIGTLTLRSDDISGESDNDFNENFASDDTQFGGNIGFGVMGFAQNVGIRADVRYFRAFGDNALEDALNLDPGTFEDRLAHQHPAGPRLLARQHRPGVPLVAARACELEEMMTIRQLAAAAAALALAAAPAVAQDRPAAAPAAAGKITVVGCVERADQILSRENLGTTRRQPDVRAGESRGRQSIGSAAAGPALANRTAGRPTVSMSISTRSICTSATGWRSRRRQPPNTPVGTTGRADAEPRARLRLRC